MPSVRTERLEVASSWAHVQPRVMRVLRARGVDRWTAEDILQEVALRALSRPGTFESEEHLRRWCTRVAANLGTDAARAEARRRRGALPQAEDAVDTARVVEGRLALAAVLSGMTRLSEADRRALLGPARASDRRTAVREAVRRHRARARLAAMVEGLLVILGLLRRALRHVRPAQATAAAVPVVLAATIVLLPRITDQPPRDRLHEPVPSRAPAAATQELTVSEIGTGENRGRSIPAGPESSSVTTARGIHAPTASTVVTAPPVQGKRLFVSEDPAPEDPKTLCLNNVAGHDRLCVDRPGPALGPPEL